MKTPLEETLFLDFETSPIVGCSWVSYDADLFHIIRDVQIISVAWSWGGDDEVFCISLPEFKGYKPGWLNVDDRKLVKSFIPIFNRAKAVVAHNGKGFDFRLWRTRLIVHGFTPPPHIIEIDTKSWAKSNFRFTSNSQDGISRQLGTPRKIETEKNLHYKCIELGDPRAWHDMCEYNKGDIVGMKANAMRLAPFVKNAPNANGLMGTSLNCRNPMCASPDVKLLEPRFVPSGGMRNTYVCKKCGASGYGPIIRGEKVLLK